MTDHQKMTTLPLRQPNFPSRYNDAPPSYQAATTPQKYAKRVDSLYEESASPDELSSYSRSGSESLTAEEEAFVNDNLKSIPAPLSNTSYYPRLQKAIAIPQIAVGSKIQPPMPFTRAYPVDLAQYGLSKTDFIKIIDTLNVCLAQAAPFQVMQAASMVIGFVPHYWALAASAGLGVAAGAGSAATIYIRAKKLFKKMNQEVWEPRGLKMNMLKGEAMLDAVGLSEQRVWDMMEKNYTVPLAQRRLDALSPYIAQLDFDIPAPDSPKNILDKLSAKQQQRKVDKKNEKQQKKNDKAERKADKRERKAIKYGRDVPVRNELQAAEEGWDSSSSSDSDSDTESIWKLEKRVDKYEKKKMEVMDISERKLKKAAGDEKKRKLEKKRDEKLKDIEKEIRKDTKDLSKKRQRVCRKDQKRAVKRERKSEKRSEGDRKKIQRLQWIVIRPLDELDQEETS